MESSSTEGRTLRKWDSALVHFEGKRKEGIGKGIGIVLETLSK